MGAPHDYPSITDMVAAVRDWIERDVMPAGSQPNGFHARVAANMLAIVQREIDFGPAQASRHHDRLALFGVADDAAWCAAIRAGDLDDRLDEVRTAVHEAVRDKLAVANPRYLERVEP